ncbi:MAG TPA: DUF5777 family beta-barrel protein [Vicinamibacterales bacterium]|nr:DUF5777 family beta-barrel protein [Vicinamibacterales bacterium]
MIRTLTLVAVLALCVPQHVWAQAPAASLSPTGAASAAAQDDPDTDPNDAQPDFFISTIPTTLRLPKHKMAFRLTHRFGRPLGQGDAGELLENFFGLDSGAVMGFGLSYGIIRGGQVSIYRTSDRTIQFAGQYEVLDQKRAPLGAVVAVNVDGTNNFRDSYSPGVQLILSRELGEHGALYLAPSYVNNSSPEPQELVDDNDTIMLGLGARLRLRRNTYVTVEGSPRMTGYAPGVPLVAVGLEQRAGGHVFQLTFSNGLGTTLAQVARGGTARDDWYIGFNLSRKFF